MFRRNGLGKEEESLCRGLKKEKSGVALTFVGLWVGNVPAELGKGRLLKEAKETAMRGPKKSSKSFFVNQRQGKGD